MKRRSFSVAPAQTGARLDRLIASKLKLELPMAEKLVSQGAVYLDGVRCKRARQRLVADQSIQVVLEEGGRSALAPSLPPKTPLRILLEDESLIAVDKPAGVLAQSGPSREGESLLDQLAAHLGRRPGLVHRLDRETSGVMVFGKTRQAVSRLAEQFRSGVIAKRYVAVTGPDLPVGGRIDLPVGRDPGRIGRFRALRGGTGLPAQTLFVRLFEARDFCLTVLYPRTGRTHQLRAHLSAAGAPIAGDRLYGGFKELRGRKLSRCLLHAQAMQIFHPRTQMPLLLEASLPEDLEVFFTLASVVPPDGQIPLEPLTAEPSPGLAVLPSAKS